MTYGLVVPWSEQNSYLAAEYLKIRKKVNICLPLKIVSQVSKYQQQPKTLFFCNLIQQTVSNWLNMPILMRKVSDESPISKHTHLILFLFICWRTQLCTKQLQVYFSLVGQNTIWNYASFLQKLMIRNDNWTLVDVCIEGLSHFGGQLVEILMVVGCDIYQNLGARACIYLIGYANFKGEVRIGLMSIKKQHQVAVRNADIDMRNGLLKSEILSKEPSDSKNSIRTNLFIVC